MSPDFIFNIGALICAASGVCAVIAAVILRGYKKRLDRRLDEEYGKRKQVITQRINSGACLSIKFLKK